MYLPGRPTRSRRHSAGGVCRRSAAAAPQSVGNGRAGRLGPKPVGRARHPIREKRDPIAGGCVDVPRRSRACLEPIAVARRRAARALGGKTVIRGRQCRGRAFGFLETGLVIRPNSWPRSTAAYIRAESARLGSHSARLRLWRPLRRAVVRPALRLPRAPRPPSASARGNQRRTDQGPLRARAVTPEATMNTSTQIGSTRRPRGVSFTPQAGWWRAS